MGEHKIFLREMNWVDGGEIKEETNWVRKESCEKKNKRQGSWAKSFIWENIKILKDERGEAERMREKMMGYVLLRKKGEVKINKLK